MTTYNGERFLKEQLDSILRQSRQVDELVVCDDGSVDGTVNILNEFYSTAPFPVRIIINEKNLGVTRNFEKAISLCEGDIIVLCDQDDVWLPDKVKILESVFLINADCEMVFTNALVVDEGNNPLNELWSNYGFDERNQKILKDGNGLRLFVEDNMVTGATAAIAKQFFEEAAPFPAGLVHDHWLAAAAALKGKLFFCGAVTVNYRKHPSQQLGTPSGMNLSQRANRDFDYDKAINTMRVMLEGLDNKFHLKAEQKKMFTDKIGFYLFRRNLPKNRLIRARKIFLNLFSGNYHKFSAGFLSMAKDLIMRAV
jgi:glycosyltransferase involved in cell wall biosynthesis